MLSNNIPIQYNKHTLKTFELNYGKVMENVTVEYITSGNPKYDENGYITNAIVFCNKQNGQPSVIRGAHNYLESKGKFNKGDFFFIVITSLGIPNSYSPSTSNLMSDFPEYNIIDIVNFKRQFLSEKFKIKKIFGIIGEENEGYEVFTWACEYPDDMDFILILNSDFKTSGYRFIISKCFDSIV